MRKHLIYQVEQLGYIARIHTTPDGVYHATIKSSSGATLWKRTFFDYSRALDEARLEIALITVHG